MTLFRSREMRVFWIFAGALMVEDIRDLMMTIYILVHIWKAKEQFYYYDETIIFEC